MTDMQQLRSKYLDRAKTGQIYFRVNARRLARLPNDESSPQFAAEYDYLLGEHTGKPVGPITHLKRLIPGSYVYFLQSNDLVKIGVSTKPAHRLYQLRGASPQSLKLLGTVRGGRDVERFIHRLFRKHRKHGEWFAIEGKLAEFLREEFSKPIYSQKAA